MTWTHLCTHTIMYWWEQDNQGALRILKLSLIGNGCPKIYDGILTMPWEKN
jgi:hypothetical protein